MALTDDQKAMLRLLAQREQGYEDIAALTGRTLEEVRAKVREALAALGTGAGPADDQRAILRLLAQREQGYEDIAALTGQTLEEVRAKVRAALEALGGGSAPTSAPAPAPPPTLAPPPAESRSAPAPAAPAPPPPALRPPAQSAPAQSGGGRWRRLLPADRGALWGLGAGLGVVLLLIVLLATGVLGGGSGSGAPSGSEPSRGSGEGKTSQLNPTEAKLEPVGGGRASGRALFGRDKHSVVLLLRAEGLPPSPAGKSYAVSLAKSASEKLPLITTRVERSGTISGSFQIAPQVLSLLATGFDTMEVSLVANSELGRALKAAKSAKAAPNYGGQTELRGKVTGAIVEAGEKGTVKP